MRSNTSNKETTNLSCRIEKIIYDELIEESKNKGISLNSLVSSIFRHHVTWEKFSNDLGLVPMTKPLVEIIFRELDDKTIELIAKEFGIMVPKALLYLSGNSMNFENMMRALEISGKRFGAVKHTSLQGIHNININHGMGENFSKFIASVHKRLADNLSYKFELANIDKNMVCMHISESKKS